MEQSKELTIISSYLTKEYLDEHLTKWFGQKTEYLKHEFDKDTNKGDYYLSDVWRVKVFGKKADKSECQVKLIIKSLPQNIGRRKTFRSADVFENEINFYKLVLPKLLEFQSRYNVDEPFDHTPKVFAAETDGDNDFLALEDLSVQGYRSHPRRQEAIDYGYFKSILDTFAKFHALSFAFKSHHPEEYKKLEKCVSEKYYAPKYIEWYGKFWENICNCSIDAVKKEFPGTIYENKIKEFAQMKTYNTLIKAVNDGNITKVMTHGDSWTPNFLFSYESDNTTVKKTAMIDFQLARSGMPVLDISFFIYATTSEELRKLHYEKGLKFYHTVLSKQVKQMGVEIKNIYPFETFMDEIKKYSYYGLGFSLESVSVIVLEPEDAFPMDSIEGTDAIKIEDIWVLKPMKKKEDRLRLANNVKHAVDNGFI